MQSETTDSLALARLARVVRATSRTQRFVRLVKFLYSCQIMPGKVDRKGDDVRLTGRRVCVCVCARARAPHTVGPDVHGY